MNFTPILISIFDVSTKKVYRSSLLSFISQRLFSHRLMAAFLGVCSILIYIKYYTEDHNTAVYHLGYVASGFSIAVYGSPLVSVVRVKMNSGPSCSIPN